MPLHFRDYCAHILIPLNDCRHQTWFSPFKCTDLRHAYEKCEFDECASARTRRPRPCTGALNTTHAWPGWCGMRAQKNNETR